VHDGHAVKTLGLQAQDRATFPDIRAPMKIEGEAETANENK
jgi:hypothetical protein